MQIYSWWWCDRDKTIAFTVLHKIYIPSFGWYGVRAYCVFCLWKRFGFMRCLLISTVFHRRIMTIIAFILMHCLVFDNAIWCIFGEMDRIWIWVKTIYSWYSVDFAIFFFEEIDLFFIQLEIEISIYLPFLSREKRYFSIVVLR